MTTSKSVGTTNKEGKHENTLSTPEQSKLPSLPSNDHLSTGAANVNNFDEKKTKGVHLDTSQGTLNQTKRFPLIDANPQLTSNALKLKQMKESPVQIPPVQSKTSESPNPLLTSGALKVKQMRESPVQTTPAQSKANESPYPLVTSVDPKSKQKCIKEKGSERRNSSTAVAPSGGGGGEDPMQTATNENDPRSSKERGVYKDKMDFGAMIPGHFCEISAGRYSFIPLPTQDSIPKIKRWRLLKKIKAKRLFQTEIN